MGENDNGPGMDHTTVVPKQLRRDEVHFIVTGEDLRENLDETAERAVADAINTVLEEQFLLDYDSVSVEYDQEDK